MVTVAELGRGPEPFRFAPFGIVIRLEFRGGGFGVPDPFVPAGGGLFASAASVGGWAAGGLISCFRGTGMRRRQVGHSTMKPPVVSGMAIFWLQKTQKKTMSSLYVMYPLDHQDFMISKDFNTA